jgi:hypothetical protein
MEYQEKRHYDPNHTVWAQLRFYNYAEELRATIEIEEKCLAIISKTVEVDGQATSLWEQAWAKQCHKIQHELDEAEDQAVNNVGSYNYSKQGSRNTRTPHWTMNFTTDTTTEWDYPLPLSWHITSNAKNSFIGYDQKIYDEKMATFGLFPQDQLALKDSKATPAAQGANASRDAAAGGAPSTPVLNEWKQGNPVRPTQPQESYQGWGPAKRGGPADRDRREHSGSPSRGTPYDPSGTSRQENGPDKQATGPWPLHSSQWGNTGRSQGFSSAWGPSGQTR